MKIDETTVHAVSSEEFKTLAFRVDQKMAQIIFRDKLYSAEGKIRVIVQEYMANARDAHRVAGKSDTPIDVTLPTSLAPEFIVRDYGNGIPPNIIEDIFVVYGASTKKNSNLENGGYGIGAKCAFSYVNAFSVTTTVAGVRYIYAASIDSEGMNQFTLMDSGPATGPDGTEVRVPIKSSDIGQLRTWVTEIAHAWTPRPNVTNNVLVYKDVQSEAAGERWELYHQCSPFAYRMFFRGITVTVDDIPYTMTPDQSRAIGGSVETLYGLLSSAGKCLVLHFRVGEVTIPPQREAIDVTPRTKNAITAAVDKFVAVQVQSALAQLQAAVTPLEKVALALKESFELVIARSLPGVFKTETAACGKNFATEGAGIRVYEGKYNRGLFRDFTEMPSVNLANLANPRAHNKFVVDTKGKKMSTSDLKRLIRNAATLGYGDVFVVAIHDAVLFKNTTEVDPPLLERIANYKFCEREVSPPGSRKRVGGHFFIKYYKVGFSKYSNHHHELSSARSKVEDMPNNAVFVDVENGKPLYHGKPITLDRLCELTMLHSFLRRDGQLGTEYVYGWEDRFNGTYSPSEYIFLEDALIDATERVLDLSPEHLIKLAMSSPHHYVPSQTWLHLPQTAWVNDVCTKLGYNKVFVDALPYVIRLEDSDPSDDVLLNTYVGKLLGLLDDETRTTLEGAMQGSVKRLYDVRDEFASIAYSSPLTALLLTMISTNYTLNTRVDGSRVAMNITDVLLDNLKNHKPINPLFKA